MTDPYGPMSAAVLARLEGDSALSGASFDSSVKGSPEAYAVFYLQRVYEYRSGSADPTAVDWTLTVHSVALDAVGARSFSGRVTGQLNGWRPSVDGWRSGQLRHTASTPADYDTSVAPAIVYCVDQFSWRSDRA